MTTNPTLDRDCVPATRGTPTRARPIAADVVHRFVDAVGDGAIVVGTDGAIRHINEAAGQLFGYSPDELEGLPLSVLDVLNLPLGRDDDFTASVEAAGNWEGYSAGIHRDGATFPVNISIVSLTDTAGERQGYVAIYRNVQNLEDLRDALRIASSVRQTRRQIINSITHEFRTPLAAIIGFADLLTGMEGLPEGGKEFLEAIRSSADRLSGLIESVIEYASVQAEQSSCNSEPYSVRSRLEVLGEPVRARLAARGIRWDLQISPEVPDEIVVDGEKLDRVLRLLLDNAEKFTHSGHISLGVALSPKISDMVEFSVRDSGIGFEPAVMNQLFEPFRQMDDGLNRKYGGIGLGLALARQLTDVIGATLRTDGRPGQGSDFLITVPMSPPDTPDDVEL